MRLVGLVRLGRDAEIRFAANGDPVAGFSGAYNYGRKDQDGRRPSQWVELSLWGKRAESLAPYLVKGSQVEVFASDVHVETYDKRDGGQGVKLVGRVDDLELVSSRGDDSGERPAPAPAPARAPAPPPSRALAPSRSSTSLADMDDDIPF